MRKGHIRSKHDVRMKNEKNSLMYTYRNKCGRRNETDTNTYNRQKNYDAYSGEERRRSKRRIGDLGEREERANRRRINEEHRYVERKSESSMKNVESGNNHRSVESDKSKHDKNYAIKRRNHRKWEEETSTNKSEGRKGGPIEPREKNETKKENEEAIKKEEEETEEHEKEMREKEKKRRSGSRSWGSGRRDKTKTKKL